MIAVYYVTKFRRAFILSVILVSIIIVILTQVSTESPRATVTSTDSKYIALDKPNSQLARPEFVTSNQIIAKNLKFNVSGEDLLVFLHIQKTGGTTFEKHLVRDLNIEPACLCSNSKRRCDCKRPGKGRTNSFPGSTWLVSRFSTGWICGLHPDWTQLQACLAGLKKLFLVTWLRHPLYRTVSEFRHVHRGATWRSARSYCKQYDTQLCYPENENWLEVSLDEFLDCPSNMGINRQTRMLADYSKIECMDLNDQSGGMDSKEMLDSAKQTLKRMAFFGLCEHQRASQFVFERTLGLDFARAFSQSQDNKTVEYVRQLPERLKKKIMSRNRMDLKLYQYATELFEERCRNFKDETLCKGIASG